MTVALTPPVPAAQQESTSTETLDLESCAREAIHIPGAIQPHGHLLAFESGPDLMLAHASAAAADAVLLADLAASIGRPLKEVLQVDQLEHIWNSLRNLPERGLSQLGRVHSLGGTAFDAVAHYSLDRLVVLELLDAPPAEGQHGFLPSLQDYYPLLRDALDRLANMRTIDAILESSAREIRAVSGFDRVLVYRFEANWDGTVVAEDRDDRLPSYAGLRFPASDIPPQARMLYTLNPVRTIPDISYVPVPIYPDRHRRSGRPVDLSLAMLRSVSPSHLEYMRNMGTPASMSLALPQADRLWGLITCHHAEPRRIGPAASAACDLIAKFVAAQITAKEEASHALEAARLKQIETRLLAKMAAAQGNLVQGLSAAAADLCALTGAAGAAVVTPNECRLVGRTPRETDVQRMAHWLQENDISELFETSALASVMPGVAANDGEACGLLAIRISRLHAGFVLWFRPEIIQTVLWGGEPTKPGAADPADQIGPRRSFDTWKQTVRGTAVRWTQDQIAAARSLRTAVIDIVLRHAEERADMTDRLERVNAELAAFCYSVSHDLRAPFRHIVGYAELLLETQGPRLDDKGQRFVSTIIESAQTAALLVDALLNFSRMGSASVMKVEVDVQTLVAEAIAAQEPDAQGRDIDWRVGPLPTVSADPLMLRQILYNLLSNAVKYTRGKETAVIEVKCIRSENEFVFSVRDNGIGFEMAYAHKLFGVFQRLHRVEDYEGVGIGLANVRRMVERHTGRTWAEGILGEGATFFFSLPVTELHVDHADRPPVA